MVSAYFGLPRCGKTTILSALALKESKKIDKGKSRYSVILSNVPLDRIPHTMLVNFPDIGVYDLPHNALYLIDEASVHLDSRSYKTTPHEFLDYLALHGHYADDFKHSNDIVFFLQTVKGYDYRARSLTENLFYVKKILCFSLAYRIPYKIVFPEGENLGDIAEGYRKPSLFQMLTGKWFYRPKYYDCFDSLSKPLKLKPFKLSETYKANNH